MIRREDDMGFIDVKNISRPRSWAVYGRSGSGKTTFAATFPKPILLLDIKDQGTDSIADVKGITVKEIGEWDEIEEIYYWLKKNPKRFKTVVFDTITQMQQLYMAELNSRRSKRAGDKSRVGDWGTMTRREWGDVSGTMKTWVTDFRDLGLEVVFLAQERVSGTEEDEDNPDNMITPEVGPAVIKSVAITLNAAVSIIGNTFIRVHRHTKKIKAKRVEKVEPQYCMRIGPNPVYTTKIRKPRSIIAPSFIEDPTYADVIDLIKGE